MENKKGVEFLPQLPSIVSYFLSMNGYPDYKPNYNNLEEVKYKLSYSHKSKKWIVLELVVLGGGLLIFPTKELAEKFVVDYGSKVLNGLEEWI